MEVVQANSKIKQKKKTCKTMTMEKHGERQKECAKRTNNNRFTQLGLSGLTIILTGRCKL